MFHKKACVDIIVPSLWLESVRLCVLLGVSAVVSSGGLLKTAFRREGLVAAGWTLHPFAG
jgi:hypothetical protein